MAKTILTEGMVLRGGSYEAIDVRGRNVTIEDVRVEGDGIALYANHNCSGLTVRNSTFVSRKKNAVKIVADNVAGYIEGIRFEHCEINGARMGVELQNHGTPMEPPAEGVPKEWYKIRDVELDNCLMVASGDADDSFGLSLTGYGKRVQATNCRMRGRKKGVEVAGFSLVTLQNCVLVGGKEAFISSNKRPMHSLIVRLCDLSGKAVFTNTTDSRMDWCTVAGEHVEVKHSGGITINGCTIRSTGRYGILLNSSRDCLVQQNAITQTGSNYSVIRCYLKGSTANIIRDNTLQLKKPKKGKWWDQYGGATGNTFELNTKKEI